MVLSRAGVEPPAVHDEWMQPDAQAAPGQMGMITTEAARHTGKAVLGEFGGLGGCSS
jgi:hypothetical protein